jgi:catechol-2,3-dioxygenase
MSLCQVSLRDKRYNAEERFPEIQSSRTMSDIPLIQLDHINIPASKPEWLAQWYADNFGFNAHKGFVSGPGTLLVFEAGKPLDYSGNVHFGFRCSSRDKVRAWALKFEANLVEDENYSGFKTKDPEGNLFEVYWEE